MLKRNRTWLVPAAALAMMGCPDEELAPLEPCTVSGVSERITQSGSDQLDLLFVMDDSGSMREEQQKLQVQLERLVRILTTGDLNQDGDNSDEGDFEPVGSLHLGVISTDMGTYGVRDAPAPNDSCNDEGDDGRLLKNVGAPRAMDAECMGLETEAYQVFEPEDGADVGAEADRVATEFGCVAIRGTGGCGLEQQLEAMLKAVTPEDSEIEFVEGKGRGTGSNDGFVRDDAVLAIIHVSDEEDCSTTEKGKLLFADDAEQVYNGPDGDIPANQVVGVNFQCANATDNPDEDPKDLLQPAQRYIDGLKALKPDNPDRIIFAGIVGIPEAAEDMMNGEVQAFDAILELEDMQVLPGTSSMEDDRRQCTREEYAADPARCGVKNVGGPGSFNAQGALPRPACAASGGAGWASPARRFVEVAKGFAENAILQSICSDTYEQALRQIITKISKKLTGACLPSPLNPDSKGVVLCDVVEILGRNGKPADCAAGRGRKFKEMREVEVAGETQMRVVCDVNQVAVQDKKLVAAPAPLEGVDPLVGWYYDNFTAEVTESCPEGKRQRIATTMGAEPTEGASFNFECFNPVGGSIELTGKGAVGAPCNPADNKCKGDDDYDLACEPATKTCQITCGAESDCPDGWVCDEVDDNTAYCINPKCPPAQ